MSKLTEVLLGLASLAVVAGAGLSLISGGGNPTLGGDIYNRFTSVSTTTLRSVGPDISIQVLATSSSRSFANFSNNGSGATGSCWLSFANDAPAQQRVGILLAATSTYDILPGNLYTGAVQARCVSSTTIAVTEK